MYNSSLVDTSSSFKSGMPLVVLLWNLFFLHPQIPAGRSITAFKSAFWYQHAKKPRPSKQQTILFNGLFCPWLPGWPGRQFCQYQKGKTNLDFTEARDSEWQWNQLGHMQVCTSLQTDNYASTPPLSFLQAGCPPCHPTNSVKALKAQSTVKDEMKTKVKQGRPQPRTLDNRCRLWHNAGVQHRQGPPTAPWTEVHKQFHNLQHRKPLNTLSLSILINYEFTIWLCNLIKTTCLCNV